MRATFRILLIVMFILSYSTISFAQNIEQKTVDNTAKNETTEIVDPDPAPSPSLSPSMSPSPTPRREGNFIKNSFRDQKLILTSPFRVKKSDMKWILPFAAITTALVLSDSKTSTWVRPNGKLSTASLLTGYGGSIYATAGVAAGLYLIGGAMKERRVKKTGKLAFEALLGTGVVVGVLKHSLGRMRPNGAELGHGHFFENGGRSFPSGHSSSAWAVATVIASEYKDRPLIRYGAIAAAILISLSRYTGRAHFMSEVIVGSAIGIATGRFVYLNRR